MPPALYLQRIVMTTSHYGCNASISTIIKSSQHSTILNKQNINQLKNALIIFHVDTESLSAMGQLVKSARERRSNPLKEK